ncbi:hypothetical protein [Peribacillus simplex]|uniref:hypothetical protein n=1 Tax=Peribacillus simplex TaxID=1478 RepID=UPI003D00C6B3
MKILEKDIDILLAGLAEDRSVFKAAFSLCNYRGRFVYAKGCFTSIREVAEATFLGKPIRQYSF